MSTKNRSMSGARKIQLAVEARNPGCIVTQMTDLRGLPADVTDKLMVAVVNAGPPMVRPEQLEQRRNDDY